MVRDASSIVKVGFVDAYGYKYIYYSPEVRSMKYCRLEVFM